MSVGKMHTTVHGGWCKRSTSEPQQQATQCCCRVHYLYYHWHAYMADSRVWYVMNRLCIYAGYVYRHGPFSTFNENFTRIHSELFAQSCWQTNKDNTTGTENITFLVETSSEWYSLVSVVNEWIHSVIYCSIREQHANWASCMSLSWYSVNSVLFVHIHNR